MAHLTEGEEERGQGVPWLITANATWTSLKRVLPQLKAHVMCLQELKLGAGRFQAVSASMLMSGWKMSGTPSYTKEGGLSSGVAIVVPGYVEVWHRPGQGGVEIFPGRATTLFCRILGLGTGSVQPVLGLRQWHGC